MMNAYLYSFQVGQENVTSIFHAYDKRGREERNEGREATEEK